MTAKSSDNTHWITSHDPAQGYIEVIRASPLSPHGAAHSEHVELPTTEGGREHPSLHGIFNVTKVPVTKEYLSEGEIKRPDFGPFPPEKNLVSTFFVDFPPGTKETDPVTLHRTNTLDIDCCVFGQITHVLASGQRVTLNPGDTLVQRGTNHMWANLTDKPARLVCTMITATDDAIAVNNEVLPVFFDNNGTLPKGETIKP